MLEKILDLFMFREGTEEELDGTRTPIITTGSIVWGILLRTALIIFITFLFYEQLNIRKYWWISLFILWFVAIYPGWRQFNIFKKRSEKLKEETLCGSCKYFDETGQLCRIYDEHISREYIPCGGQSWEPRHFDSED